MSGWKGARPAASASNLNRVPVRKRQPPLSPAVAVATSRFPQTAGYTLQTFVWVGRTWAGVEPTFLPFREEGSLSTRLSLSSPLCPSLPVTRWK